LHPYKFTISPDRLGYEFSTANGIGYVVYFNEFFLMDRDMQDVCLYSFGFDYKASSSNRIEYDRKIKDTVIFILQDFFRQRNEDAIIYICQNNDSKSRGRSKLFDNWFLEFSDTFEKYDSEELYNRYHFYSSIIASKYNPVKQKLIDAFYFTISYWLKES
jgi:Family of unknown function (DUF6169)